MSFSGKRVLAFESRRAVETAELIRRNGGEPIVAPSMREVPLERNEEALRFGEGLHNGLFDMVILLTGVGTRQLLKVLATRYDPAATAAALGRVTLVARGPKPTAALREMGLTPHVIAPEPNTWREVLASIAGRSERRVAIQEYGRPSTELLAFLKDAGCDVTPVPVYSYELPEDLQPLRDAAQVLMEASVDVTLFTTGTQLIHLMHVARETHSEDAVLAGLRRTLIASIGPTTTETLHDYGLTPDLEPSHPKLGLLVKEAAEQSAEILCRKIT
jgi:uroporphyrinogen-III synthase